MTKRLGPLLVLALFGAGCGDDSGPSGYPEGTPLVCDDAQIEEAPEWEGSAVHVSPAESVEYQTSPPAIGSHYGLWLSWGRYNNPIKAENYVHNLEHGGIAILHNCEGDDDCEALVDGLEVYARNRPLDDGGPFRWILAPWPEMPSRVALVAWGWVLHADCLKEEEFDAFIDAHYRMAPEDVASGGSADHGG